LKQNRGFLFGARRRRDPASIPDPVRGRLSLENALETWLVLPPVTLSNPAAIARSARGSPNFAPQARAKAPDWYNAPVDSFGDPNAQLLIVGLAPGMQGANRTGRPFTGDYAGDLLYATLLDYGFAKGSIRRGPTTGLRWSIAGSATPCAACRRRTSRCRRDQYLPAIPHRDHGRDAQGACESWRLAGSPMTRR
jgi:hypothetical protein